MDQDATCYGGRPCPGDNVVLDVDPAPPMERVTAAPHFSAHLVLAHVYCGETVAYVSYC